MSTNRWKWIYNPFEFIAGWKAFAIGGGVLVLTTLIGWLGNTVFYGLEVKVTSGVSLGAAVLLQAMGLAVTVLVMYVAALILARKVRFEDILGCIALAKYPLLLTALVFWLFGGAVAAIEPQQIIDHQVSVAGYVWLVLFGVFGLVTLVWEVALMYHAFRVSTNLKGLKCTLPFIVVLLLVEIVVVALAGYIY